jgi:hypothetical protein
MEEEGPPFTYLIGSFLSWQPFMPLMTTIITIVWSGLQVTTTCIPGDPSGFEPESMSPSQPHLWTHSYCITTS